MPFKSILIKDTSKKKKFWKKERSLDELLRKKFERAPKTTLSSSLTKFCKKTGKQEPYTFFLIASYFGYYNLNESEIRYVDLSLCFMKEIKPRSDGISGGFTLTRHNTNIKDFFVNSASELNIWYREFRKFCMQMNFLTHYTLHDQLGKGNFASVFRAKCRRDGKSYAAKVIPTEGLAKSSKLRQAVRTELIIHRSLNHPHIVSFIEAFEDEEKIYIVSEMMEGGELFERVMKKKKYTEKDAASVMKQMMEALVYLEKKGIVHRDLKLENVLLVKRDDDSFVKIADFGLSASIQGLDTKVRCGTPGYLAPEIILEKPYDHKADIFSVGAMLYIMLSGCTPFPGKTFDEILSRNKRCNPKFNTNSWNNVSFEAIDFVMQLMATDPAKRISASEALKSNWIKSCLGYPVSSGSDVRTESIVTVKEKSIEYKINIEIKEAKTMTETDQPATILGYLSPKPQENMFAKKFSLTSQPDGDSLSRTFLKRQSLVSDQNQNSMHKKVIQRNLLKKLETFDPEGVDEVTESLEQSFFQNLSSKFDFKSGLMLNSFYAKGASQGLSSEGEMPSPKKLGLDTLDISVKRSGFGRMYSGTPVNNNEDSSNEDNVPEEENLVKGMVQALKKMCFLSKPAFEIYDTTDGDLSRSKISRFPNFRNAFTESPTRVRTVY